MGMRRAVRVMARRVSMCAAVALAVGLGVGLAAGAHAQTAADAAGAQVEILVHGDARTGTHFDYVTWAPSPTLVRVRPGTLPPGATVTVVLTNGAAPVEGKGHVNFALTADDYKKAVEGGGAKDQITLTLKADGTPQPIIVAGDFPHFSRDDKDTPIVAHQGAATGPEVGRTQIMVRVRRDEETLSAEERSRFLWALAALRFQKSPDPRWRDTYTFLVDMHDIGARGFAEPTDIGYPDQEHKAAAFVAWHRAFLLELERALQKVDPSVTLPYWPMYYSPGKDGATVFHADFTGANTVAGDPDFMATELIRFDAGNPLYGWNMPGRGPLMRWRQDRNNIKLFNTPGMLLDTSKAGLKSNYAFIAGSVEANPHNIGHGWSGVWMSNCMISPSDPMFWPFHTYFDWLWAAWQQHYDRFRSDGADPAQYWPNDAYADGKPSNKTNPLGHHLRDTMWPWNEEIQPKPVETFSARRPPQTVGGPFAPSGVPGLWPQAPARPTPGELIDYAGYVTPDTDAGVGYDNLPWSPKQQSLPFQGDAPSTATALAAFLAKDRPVADRVDQAAQVDLAAASDATAKSAIQAVALTTGEDAEVRAAALDILARVDTATAVETAYKVEGDAKHPTLAHAVERVRAMEMFANRPVDTPTETAAAPAPKAVSVLDKGLYAAARNGVPDNNSCVVGGLTVELRRFLAKPTDTVRIFPQDATAFVASTNLFEAVPAANSRHVHGRAAASCATPFNKAVTLDTMRRLLKASATTPTSVGIDWWKTKALAATVLAHSGDGKDINLVKGLAADAKATVDARAAAVNSLRHMDEAAFEGVVGGLDRDRTAPAELKAQAIAAVGAYVQDHGRDLPPDQRARLAHLLDTLSAASPAEQAALKTARRMLALAAG
ncbi:common central domain of tyrosinase [Nitrospirillum amazonense]|uniref:Common central domain of tyrosinase n=2 Tax=Nitrospirillum amazonense TaxID=28077 RepID=A0A560FJT8_9PROT|nr:common central domain of tyrosinase [Nitrospirillum amazonense]